MSIENQFAAGDAVLIEGTEHDGKVGTVLRVNPDGKYLVALEDNIQILIYAEHLHFRH